MSTARLRIRVLTVLGLPALACTKQAQSGGDGEPTVLDIPVLASASSSSAPLEDELDEELFTHPSARAFDCGQDRSRAIVCGRMHRPPDKPAKRPYEQCSETADSVSREVVVGRHPTLAKLDTALTARFRKHKTSTDKSCCYSQCVDVKSFATSPPVPTGYGTRVECIASMRRGSKHPAEGRSDCAAAVDFGSGPDGGYPAPFDEKNTEWRAKAIRDRTGFEDLNLCCYQDAMHRRPPIRGRALRGSSGDTIVAPSTACTTWARAFGSIAVDGLGAPQRGAITRRWTRDAELEHASVASFSQLSLSLLACGAPPALVAETHRSALDEIRHAEICYGLATRYAGRAIGPGLLALPPQATSNVIALAVETYRDGCVGETAAALIAARSAAVCKNPVVTRALMTIAGDEERHAELAWRILRWTLAFDGVREALLAELEVLHREPEPPMGQPGELELHGLLARATEVRIRSEVVKQVVIPCTEALLKKAGHE